jgi:hypothetical protein
VDITSIYSTSTLSLKIFRVHFMKTIEDSIMVLKPRLDNFIRKGYFGGATDYYKAYSSNLKYYDVNSLYPHVMMNDMPHEVIKHHRNMCDIKLEDLFGFFKVEVETPNDILKPMLPFKDPDDNKIIFPTGKWIGIYFTEELKAVAKLGYKIKLI